MVRILLAFVLSFLTVLPSLASGYASGGVPVPVSVANGGGGSAYGALPGGSVPLAITADNHQLLYDDSSVFTVGGALANPDVVLPPIATSKGKLFCGSVLTGCTGTFTLKLHADNGGTTVFSAPLGTYGPIKFLLFCDGTSWNLMSASWNGDQSGFVPSNFAVFGQSFFASLISAQNGVTVAGSVTATGNIANNTAGGGLQIKEGSNAMLGTATLSGGTVTVNNTSVATGDRIFITRVSGTEAEEGQLEYTISNGASFTITSNDAQDDSVVNWMIVRPTP
jgi:hypothetical protein